VSARLLPRPRLDLPLQRDGSGRFLPWIIALMVYLAALSLAGMMALSGAVSRWDRALAGTVTVQLPPGSDAQLTKLLETLRATPGVASAQPLDDAANAKLLEPWLGQGVTMKDLQLPRLIDVRIAPEATLDRGALAGALAEVAPAARLSDDRRWLAPLLDTAVAVEATAAAIVALVSGAAVLSIVFATRTSLAIHHGAVEVLHLIGARDSYIAEQFQWQALRLGLRGALVGLIGAALTLLALSRAADAGEAFANAAAVLPKLSLVASDWMVLLLLAPAAGLTALVTARLTVLRALSRMP
jgi:cell division transport system permease protein